MRVFRSVISRAGGAMLVAGIAVGVVVSAQQLPMSPIKDFGENVTPAYEGWYRMPGGGRALLIGNAKLMGDQGVDVAGLEARAAELASGGKTPMFVAMDGQAAGLVAVAYGAIQALALMRVRHAAGSASALLGTSSFLIGAIASPLVGVAGEDTAVPMAVVQLSATLVAAVCFVALCRPWNRRTTVGTSKGTTGSTVEGAES